MRMSENKQIMYNVKNNEGEFSFLAELSFNYISGLCSVSLCCEQAGFQHGAHLPPLALMCHNRPPI